MSRHALILAAVTCGLTLGIPAAADSQVDAAEEAVRLKLKDPASAQFRNVQVLKDGKVVCGEVNAKNSFGGYSGFRRWYVLPESTESSGVYLEGQDDLMDRMGWISTVCGS